MTLDIASVDVNKPVHLQERTGNLHVALLNCDRGYPSSALPQVQAAGLPSVPLGTSLLSQSIWNTSNTASHALRWHNLTCVDGQIQDSAQGLGLTSPYGCDASFEAACSADLMHHILHDDNYWAALYVPGNFSSNFVTAFGSSGGAAPAYSQMTLDYIYTQVGTAKFSHTHFAWPCSQCVSLATHTLLDRAANG